MVCFPGRGVRCNSVIREASVYGVYVVCLCGVWWRLKIEVIPRRKKEVPSNAMVVVCVSENCCTIPTRLYVPVGYPQA
jgi:hypothetical protein